MQSLYCRGACAWPTHETADLKGEEDRLLSVTYSDMNYFTLNCDHVFYKILRSLSRHSKYAGILRSIYLLRIDLFPTKGFEDK